MKTRMTLIAAALLALPLLAAAADDENARLRGEIERLKAALQAREASCAATASQIPVSDSPISAEAPGPAAAKPTTIAPSVPVPSGYKLVKVEPERPKDDRWRSRSAWEELQRGMAKNEVEALLGIEHSVTDGKDRSYWGYGKIGVNYAGSVLFVNERLAVWTTPNF